MNETSFDDVELWAMARLGRQLLVRDRRDDARSVFRGLVSLSSQYGYAWHMLGEVNRRDGQLARAIDCFRRRLELEPDAVVSRVGLAETLHLAGRTDEAVAALSPIESAGTTDDDAQPAVVRGRALLDSWSGR